MRNVICRRGSLERGSTATGEPQAKTEPMYPCVRAMSASVPEVNTQTAKAVFRRIVLRKAIYMFVLKNPPTD